MAKKRREQWGSVSEKLVTLRLPADLWESAEDLRATVGTPEKPVSRSRVFREAMKLGLRTLERRKKQGGGA